MLRRLSIQAQLILFIVLILAVMAVGLGAFQTLRLRNAYISSERDRSQALILSISSTIEAVSPFIATLEDMTELDSRLQNLVRQSDGVEFIALVWPDGTVISHSNTSYKGQVAEELIDPSTSKTERHDISGFGSIYLTSQRYDNPLSEGADQFYVVVGSDAGLLDQETRDSIISIILGSIAGMLAAGLLAIVLMRNSITNPIRQLNIGALTFSTGDLEHRIEPRGSHELRELGVTLNQMAAELQQSRADIEAINRELEVGIAERVRDLETVAQVSAQTSEILDLQQLLQTISDLTKENFNLYHAHIYLLDDTNERLVLAAGAGEPGRIMAEQKHSIPLRMPHSLVARAARTREMTKVDDVTQATDFLPNPLLPRTRSELVLPLIARGELLGVLDVQSDIPARFNPEICSVMETLARQVAAALNNARLFTEVERTSRHEQMLSQISQQIQTAVNVEEVLQVAARELGKTLRVPHTTITLQLPSDGQDAGPKPAN